MLDPAFLRLAKAGHTLSQRFTMPRTPTNCSYWLFKSEPDVFSFDDLLGERGKRTTWEGVRNYQARNLLRDEVKTGDGVLFYHSSCKPLAVVGVAEVVREGYPDHTAFDSSQKYYDPKSDPDSPRWYMVDIKAVLTFKKPVTRERMQAERRLSGMMLVRRGARLSIQPVSSWEWQVILKLAGA